MVVLPRNSKYVSTKKISGNKSELVIFTLIVIFMIVASIDYDGVFYRFGNFFDRN